MKRSIGLLVALPALLAVFSCGDDTVGVTPGPEDGGTPDVVVDDAPAPDAGAPNYDPLGRSGTRLRRRYLESGPGAYRTIDFWDKELEMACAFGTAADGQLRCLPRGLSEVYYADSGCAGSELVFLPSLANCPQHSFGKTNGRETIFRRTTTPKVLAGGLFYYKSGASCLANGGGAIEAFLAEEIPSARFVSGTNVEEPRSGGLAVTFADGADGSRRAVSLRDTVRGKDCEVHAETGRCMPRAIAPLLLFSNSGCTLPVAAYAGTTPPDVLQQSLRAANNCVISNDYYAVGAPLAPASPIWRRDNTGACVSATPSATNTYYARGAALPITSFPETRVKQEGTGPIQARRYFDVDDKPLAHAHAFWNSMNDREGNPGKVSDGTLRFLQSSNGNFDEGYYSDAACSASPLGTYSCQADPGPYVVRLALDWSCYLRDYISYQTVYGRGAEHLGALNFTNEFVPCEVRARSPSSRYFNLAAPASPAMMPEIFLRTD